MCCDKLEKEIFKERFKKEDGLYIVFKSRKGVPYE